MGEMRIGKNRPRQGAGIEYKAAGAACRAATVLAAAALTVAVSGCAPSATLSGGAAGFNRMEDSSQLYSVRYSEDSGLLTVITEDAKGYDYEKVPRDVYEGLLNADNKDEFYKTKIEKTFKRSEF